MTLTDQKKVIDAAGQSLGRVASQAAMILRGKSEASFSPERKPNSLVVITNASKLKTYPKTRTKKYVRYSGYPGGLKFKTREQFIARQGQSALLRLAIQRMLPRNKLRPAMMKNLTVEE